MEFSSILFYVFGFCFVASSAMLVIARNTLKAAMLLILSFFSVASLWLLLEAEFLAITLILVYVGAVMVLFLFVIKMLNIDQSTNSSKIYYISTTWNFCFDGCYCPNSTCSKCWTV